MARRPRILVADDDSGVRQLLRTYLESAGYEAHTANDGVEAMDRFLSLRPDAMVLDINLPELDGFGVLKLMAAAPKDRRTAVLVLTARPGAADVKRAVKLGARDYLTKPFTEAQLRSRIARLLRPAAAPEPAIVVPKATADDDSFLL